MDKPMHDTTNGRRPRIVAVLGRLTLVATFSLLSACDLKCTPTSPDPIGCDAPQTCPSDHPARVCLSNCAAVASVGQSCSPDPCQPNATVCDSNQGLTCEVSHTRSGPLGTCQPLGYRGSLAVCTPGDTSQPCAQNLFCLDVTKFQPNCDPVDENNPQSFPMSYCSISRTESQSCDSTLAAPLCRPCGLGLDCVSGFCRRHCATNDLDCPCSTWACYSNSTNPICLQCAVGNAGADCSQTRQCCDHTLSCGTKGTCCKANGATCSSRDECCNEACVGGKCVSCTPPNQTPTTNNGDQCCPGEDYRSGVCFVACALQLGDPCTVTAFNGAPVYGTCQHGSVTSCDNFGKYVCMPSKPSTEICNGADDDCNNKVDDVTQNGSTTCPTQAPGGCNVTGHLTCSGGSPICLAYAGQDYCTGANQTVMGAHCATPAGNACSSCGDCSPNALCNSNGTTNTCQAQAGCPQPQCWLPANRNYNRNNCFVPNATNTTLVCPPIGGGASSGAGGTSGGSTGGSGG